MQIFEVETVYPNDKVRAIRTIVLAFAGDPAARWMYPDLEEYLEYFPEFVNAFGGRAFGMGGADHAGDFRGAALWLPPGVHPDDDGVVALISRSIPERISRLCSRCSSRWRSTIRRNPTGTCR